jgi:hypothetical protein
MAPIWYHGGASSRLVHDDHRWDRERFTSSLNEEGPGIYFTSKYEQAKSYGAVVVQTVLPASFRVLKTSVKPSERRLLQLYRSAPEEHQADFLADWMTDDPKVALKPYTRQDSLHGALVTLYGDLFHYDAAAWVEAVRDLGFDGTIVPKSYGVRHLVVWNPSALGDVHEAAEPDEDEDASAVRRKRNARSTAELDRRLRL